MDHSHLIPIFQPRKNTQLTLRPTTVEVKDAVAGKANVESGKAQGTAQEVAGEAKGKAAELKGQAKGKAEELKGKMS